MKRNFLQVLILFVFCTALYGDDYRLYLNRADALIRLRSEWDSGKYDSLEICCDGSHIRIPDLPDLGYRSISVDQICNTPLSAVDLAPLQKFHLDSFAFSRGKVKNLRLLPADRLRTISGNYWGELDAEELNGRNFPELETLNINILHGKELDLRGIPNLNRLVICNAPELERILLSPDAPVSSLQLSAPRLREFPVFRHESLKSLTFDAGRGFAYETAAPRKLSRPRPGGIWNFERLACLRFPNLETLRLSGIGGKTLRLPEAPRLKKLSLSNLELENLDGLKSISIRELELRRLPRLSDFSALTGSSIQELTLDNLPATRWGLPDGLPPQATVYCTPEFLETPMVIWTFYITGLILTGGWVAVYQFFIRKRKREEER
jgi:hypothetical protein